MSKYDQLDLVSIDILKTLSKYSFEEVQVILKKLESNIASTFYCKIDEEDFETLKEDIKKEIS